MTAPGPSRRRGTTAGLLSLAGPAPQALPVQPAATGVADTAATAPAAYRGRMRSAGTESSAGVEPTPADPADPETPREFTAVVESLLADAETRTDVHIREVGRPTRLAPHGIALAATLEEGDDELAAGRLVVLHDPEGQPAWNGTFRIACYARAPLDAEMSSDPMLPTVTWSWLEDALAERGAEVANLAGTVTTTSSARFGQIADEAGTSEVELRCSWSPLWDPEDAADVRAHLDAMCDLLAMMAGLPPSTGVVALSSRVR